MITLFSRLPFTIDWKGVIHHDPNVEKIDCDVLDILRHIKLETFKDKIAQLRGYYQTDKGQYDILKKQLPYIMFTGTFSQFSTLGLTATSNLACLDFDKIPDLDFSSVWNSIISDPYTFAAFKSPSGCGIKAIVKLSNDVDKHSHKEYVESLKDHFNSPYWDSTSNQLVRGCFMSSDPDCYINADAQVWIQKKFVVVPMFNTTPNPSINPPITSAQQQKAVRTMEGGWKRWAPMTPGSRHNSSFLRAREMAEHGISEDFAQEYMSQFVDATFSDYECTKCVRDAYAKTMANGNFGKKAFKYKKP